MCDWFVLSCVTSWLYHVVNSYPVSNPSNLALSPFGSKPMGWLNKLGHIRADRRGGEGLRVEHSKKTCTVYHGEACCDIGCDLVKPKQLVHLSNRFIGL